MKFLFSIAAFLLAHSVTAQTTLPVIKASSKNVSINDGGYFDKNAWSLSPKARPDIYTADRTRQTKWVSFYTDIDSIKVKVKPGTVFDFIILLNGKDSCFTRIASAIPPESLSNVHTSTHDTIPFTLTDFNAISVKSVINDTDRVNLHFDIGSFNFRLTRDAVLHKTKLLSGQPGVQAGTAQPDYNHLDKIATIQLGNLVYHNPELVVTGFTAHDMDGRFGWNLFEGKVVEINYDTRLLIIHSTLPVIQKGYAKSNMIFRRSFVCIKASFEIAHKVYAGDFLLDTGSDQAMIIDSSWAARHQFPGNLQLIKSAELKDPRGAIYKTSIVLAPMLKINGYKLTNIPAFRLGSKNPVNFEVNYLGNDLLKRFNIILDFKNDNVYLKPNALMQLPYRYNS